MAEPDEINQEGQKKEKKGGGFNIMGLLITVVIAVIASAGTSFLLLQVLGSNTPDNTTQQEAALTPVNIKVRFLIEGVNKPFMLKGGQEVVVLDMLSFVVASDAARAAIAESKDEILSDLQDLFITKQSSEMANVQGVELIRRQIRDLVNNVTGNVGDKAKFGVTEVFFHIMAITSVQ